MGGRKNKHIYANFHDDTLYWNVRGLNDPVKVRRVTDTIRSIKPDIIALSETKKMEFTPDFLCNLGGSANFSWHCLPAQNTVGGILLGINEEIFDIL